MTDGAEPVVLVRYSTAAEAELAAGRLDAAGIPVTVEPYNAFSMLPHLQLAVSPRGIAVWVPRDSAEEAARVLSLTRAEPGWGQAVEEPLVRRARRIMFFCVVGFFLAFIVTPVGWFYIVSVTRAVRARGDSLPADARRRIRRYMLIAAVFCTIGTALTALVGLAVLGGAGFEVARMIRGGWGGMGR